jgi:N-acetylmuramoyl-L-alanine amidase
MHMKKMPVIFGGLLLMIVVVGLLFWVGSRLQMCGSGSWYGQVIPEGSGFLPDHRMSYSCWGRMQKVTGIILHYTATNTVEQAVESMTDRELFVQLIIDKDGSVYQLTDNLDDFAAGATGGNSWGISIEIVGNHLSLWESAMADDEQFRSVVKTVKYLVEKYDVPITNELPANDVLAWQGIFSHEQVDKYHPKGGRNSKIDPGKEYMDYLMAALKK